MKRRFKTDSAQELERIWLAARVLIAEGVEPNEAVARVVAVWDRLPMESMDQSLSYDGTVRSFRAANTKYVFVSWISADLIQEQVEEHGSYDVSVPTLVVTFRDTIDD